MNLQSQQILRPAEGNIRIPLKITVLKIMTPVELYGGLPEDADKAAEPELRAGQSFIVDRSGRCPEDFPDAAWHDIYPRVMGLQLGGNFIGFKKGIHYSCTSDGLSPVFFRLERLEN